MSRAHAGFSTNKQGRKGMVSSAPRQFIARLNGLVSVKSIV
jgi:hypothetical protein